MTSTISAARGGYVCASSRPARSRVTVSSSSSSSTPSGSVSARGAGASGGVGVVSFLTNANGGDIVGVSSAGMMRRRATNGADARARRMLPNVVAGALAGGEEQQLSSDETVSFVFVPTQRFVAVDDTSSRFADPDNPFSFSFFV